MPKAEEPTRRKAPTLYDVARVAGVSVATASKALNDTGRMTDATRLRVKQTAAALALTWNAEVEPYAAVLHVAANGRKTVIASALTGGTASVDISALPAGGRFEVSLSSSVRGRMVKVERK